MSRILQNRFGDVTLALDSEAQIREYVEAELDRTVRDRYPELEAHSSDDYSTAPPSRYPWWRIVDVHAAGQPFYTIEARLGEREFLIWYGNITRGVWAKHFAMRQAVHLAFETVQRDPHGTEPSPYNDAASLGAVLELMLSDAQPPPTYPMNRLVID